jgi:hypothetical protein
VRHLGGVLVIVATASMCCQAIYVGCQEKKTLSLEEVKAKAIEALYYSDSTSLSKSWEQLFDDAVVEPDLSLQEQKVALLLRFTGGQDYACEHGAELVNELRNMSARESVLNLLLPFPDTNTGRCVSGACTGDPSFIDYILKEANDDKLFDIPGKLWDSKLRIGLAIDVLHSLDNYYQCTNDYKYLEAVIRMLGTNLSHAQFRRMILDVIDGSFEKGLVPDGQRSDALIALEAIEKRCSDPAFKKTLQEEISSLKKSHK